jgi:hypothetical protein
MTPREVVQWVQDPPCSTPSSLPLKGVGSTHPC